MEDKQITEQDQKPIDCESDYDDFACDGCPFNELDSMVGHPGGRCDGRHDQVEKRYCSLGYWEDNF